MSRTGVGVRLLIDGQQVDDGCVDWGSMGGWGAPWTEVRRNLIGAPRPTAFAGSGWATGGGTIDGEWVVNNTAAATTAYIFTDGSTEAQVIGDVYSAKVTYMVTALGVGTTATHISVRFHNRTGNWYFDDTRVASPISLNVEQTVTIHWTATRAAPVNDLDIALVTTNSTGTVSAVAGAGFSMRTRRPIIERGSTVGEFFDGDLPTTAPEYRYAWTGAVQNSASIEERGTWVPDYSGTTGPGVQASEGLQVTWGRGSTIDQPEPSSCTFQLVDVPGGVDYRQAVKIGSVVAVYADAELSDPDLPGVQTFTDPDFEAAVYGTPANARLTRSNRRAAAGAWAAQLQPITTGKAYSASFAPAALQPQGTNPTAWNDIPAARGGNRWVVKARVWVPAGVTVALRPVLYAAPWAAAADVITDVVWYATGGTGSWLDVGGDYYPGGPGWVGFQLQASGALQWNQYAPTVTWDQLEATTSWDDLALVFVDSVQVLAPAGVIPASSTVFTGRVTDLEATWLDSWDAPAVAVTASDYLAELANRYIGDAPFPAETVTDRAQRIMALAEVQAEGPITFDIPPSFAAKQVSWQDVDRQPAAGLLTDIAQSVDGVLSAVYHPTLGAYLKLEDPAARASMYVLGIVGGQIGIVRAEAEGALELPACDVLRDPVAFQVNVAQVATRVTVEWLEQVAGPATAGHRELVVDAQAEATFGSRSVSISTILTTQPDAVAVAERTLARLGGDWMIGGLTAADADFTQPDQAAAETLLALLEATTRGGQAVRVTGLPDWSPMGTDAATYLEGGSYTFRDGGWELELTVSRATGLGASAPWDSLPAAAPWTWDSWAPQLTWNDLRGIGAPVTA